MFNFPKTALAVAGIYIIQNYHGAAMWPSRHFEYGIHESIKDRNARKKRERAAWLESIRKRSAR